MALDDALVEQRIRQDGIGPVTVYDIAIRIGAKLGLEPRLVYLHAGTKQGAAALGLDHGREALEVEELPVELRQLRPREIEDFLCLYKDAVAGAVRRSG